MTSRLRNTIYGSFAKLLGSGGGGECGRGGRTIPPIFFAKIAVLIVIAIRLCNSLLLPSSEQYDLAINI